MLEYRCDWCGRTRQNSESWIVGLAGERNGVTGNRRQVEILKKWNSQRAAHPLAVHFCSEKHKNNYVDALFTAPWRAVNKSAVAKAAFLRRHLEKQREKITDAILERHIADEDPTQAAPKRVKSRRKKKKSKRSPAAFTDIDIYHARALGIQLDVPDNVPPDSSGK